MAVNEQRQQGLRSCGKLLSLLFLCSLVPAVLGGAQLHGLCVTGAVCWWGAPRSSGTQQLPCLPLLSLSADTNASMEKALLPAVTYLTSCAGAAQTLG